MTLFAQINRMLEPLRTRIKMMLCRAVLDIVTDSTKIQLIQADISKDSTKNKIQRLQQYGFTSHPEKGAEAIIACLNGNRDNAIALVIDDSRYRITNLPEGGVAVYDKDGNYMKMTGDGGIELQTNSGKDVKIACKNCAITLESGGKFSVNDTYLTVDN